MRYIYFWTIIFAVIFYSGCKLPNANENKPVSVSPPPFLWADELFESEEIEDGLTLTIFKTNDPLHWTHHGLTMWTVRGDEQAVFNSRTVTMAKTSGYSGGGYGIVFCHGEYDVDDEEVTAMLVIMINNEGQYIIGKALGGVFIDFGWWKSTSVLQRHSGASNKITVSFDEIAEEFCLIINDTEIERFSDNEIPQLRGGRNGYIAVVTPFDNFPASGINVRFIEEL